MNCDTECKQEVSIHWLDRLDELNVTLNSAIEMLYTIVGEQGAENDCVEPSSKRGWMDLKIDLANRRASTLHRLASDIEGLF